MLSLPCRYWSLLAGMNECALVCRAMKALKDHRNGSSKSGESGASNMNLAKSSDPFPGTGFPSPHESWDCTWAQSWRCSRWPAQCQCICLGAQNPHMQTSFGAGILPVFRLKHTVGDFPRHKDKRGSLRMWLSCACSSADLNDLYLISAMYAETVASVSSSAQQGIQLGYNCCESLSSLSIPSRFHFSELAASQPSAPLHRKCEFRASQRWTQRWTIPTMWSIW
jgi:hypothetical protein